MDVLYLDPQLENRSRSGVLDYQDADGYVSLGRTGECDRLAAWKALQPEDRNAFIWNSFIAVLTPKVFKELLSRALHDGKALGRKLLQREFRALMGEDF